MRRFFIVILLFLNLAFLFRTLTVTKFFANSRYQPDFDDGYYPSVKYILAGKNPYTGPFLQTLGPPLVFMYFIPFGLFDLHTAQTLNLVINLLAGYLCCLVLAVHFYPKSKLNGFLILSLIFYGSFLSRYSLQQGQPNLLIALIIAIVISTPKFRRLFLSTLLALKTLFILPFLIKPTKNILPIILLLLISLLFIHPSWYLDYTFRRFTSSQFISVPQASQSLQYENQTLKATMFRLGLSSFFPYVYLALIAFCLYSSLKTHNLELTILYSLLISPVLWQHYFIILFPLYVSGFFKKPSHNPILITLSFLMWYPDLRLWTLPVNLWTGLLASHFYIALILLILFVLHFTKWPNFPSTKPNA